MQITRYMSFGRFADFLTTGLAVPKASCFDDKWEGLIFYSSLEKFCTPDRGFKWNAGIEWIYVSCWHLGTEECDAMWKLYGRSDTAVAIETSTEKLEHAFSKENLDTLIETSEVEYRPRGSKKPNGVASKRLSGTDMQSQVWIDAHALFQKHSAFAFEKEFRITVVDSSVASVPDLTELPSYNPTKVLLLQATLTPDFLDKITLSPSAPPSMIEVLQSLLAKRHWQVPVVTSSLAF